MNWVYVETSALLEVVLGQPREAEVLRCLKAARSLGASELLVLEAARVLARLPGERAGPFERLARLEQHIDLCPIDADLRAHLARPFPVEPLRTLDALHLATALDVRLPGETVGFLCLDERLRANAAALGLVVLPLAAGVGPLAL